MSNHFNTGASPIPSWSPDDITVLSAIEQSTKSGLINILKFLVMNEGLVEDETLDLILVFHSVANWNDDGYSFDEAEKIVAVASEFCLVDCVYDNQVLTMAELQDNAVLFLALNEEHEAALEAAVCLSGNDRSILSNVATRPSLALFGVWEETAAYILGSMLTRGLVSDSIGSLMESTNVDGVSVYSEVEFVDVLRKLSAVGLFTVGFEDDGLATIKIEPQPAGLFLLFSNRVEMAKRLASLSF